MKRVGYYNGVIGPLEEMQIPMMSRAVYFGDGVYDAAMVLNRIPYDFEDHLDRFYNSLRLLEINNFTLSRDELKAELMKCVEAADDDDLLLYWQADRGSFPRRHNYPPEDVKANLLIMATPKSAPDTSVRVKLVTIPDTRFFHCNIKTLNLIPNVMANEHASSSGYDEAIFYRGEMVTEGSHTNVSIIKNGVIVTHPLDNMILPGITRKRILACAEKLGIPVAERSFTVDEMMEADEVFISGSSTFIKAACEVDNIPVGGKATELLESLKCEFAASVKAQCGEF